MQKTLIILLAVCLISVHAFVKRDAPAAPTTDGKDVNYLENLQKQFGDLSKQISENLKESFNPEEIKKKFNEAVSSVNKAKITDLGSKPREETVENVCMENGPLTYALKRVTHYADTFEDLKATSEPKKE